MKQFVKQLDRYGDCFGYRWSTFPGIRYSKKKSDLLMGFKSEYCWRTTASWLQWTLLRL